MTAYPASPAERTRWITSQRPPRREVGVNHPRAVFREQEVDRSGILRDVLTVILTGRECPWKCLMCDLWRDTSLTPIPPGAVVRQIESVLSQHPQPEVIKLYNAGSFFDPLSVPPQDDASIATLLQGIGRVVVECHPHLIGKRAFDFRDRLSAKLEIAVGLETVDPIALDRLNKRVSLETFCRVGEKLHEEKIDLRTFILVQPPFQPANEAIRWAFKSAAFAICEMGTGVVSLIPTRSAEGAMETLRQSGDFTPPTLKLFLEAVRRVHQTMAADARILADVWDLESFGESAEITRSIREELIRLNLSQSATRSEGLRPAAPSQDNHDSR